jgi:Ca2+-binding EF-hand superfamily protein
MVEEFGKLEVDRLFKIYKEKVEERNDFTFEDFLQMMNQLLEIDTNEIFDQSFAKLDIANEQSISVKNLRQGLLVNLK